MGVNLVPRLIIHHSEYPTSEKSLVLRLVISISDLREESGTETSYILMSDSEKGLVPHTYIPATHQFLAMMALCGLLEVVHKECVWDILPASKCSVNPEGASGPDLLWTREGGTAADAVCTL